LKTAVLVEQDNAAAFETSSSTPAHPAKNADGAGNQIDTAKIANVAADHDQTPP
jgi:hypothetical protein